MRGPRPHLAAAPGRAAVTALATLAALALLANCRVPAASRQREERTESKEMVKVESLGRVPDDYDPRVVAILREPVADDVLVSFYYMAASKSPAPNHRWELRRGGALFFVRHSGKNVTYENTFDRPLPQKPSEVLAEDDVRALYDQLDRADFFHQPGLQRLTSAQGGAYVIVRARRGDKVHDVVYENVEPPLVQYLSSVAR